MFLLSFSLSFFASISFFPFLSFFSFSFFHRGRNNEKERRKKSIALHLSIWTTFINCNCVHSLDSVQQHKQNSFSFLSFSFSLLSFFLFLFPFFSTQETKKKKETVTVQVCPLREQITRKWEKKNETKKENKKMTEREKIVLNGSFVTFTCKISRALRSNFLHFLSLSPSSLTLCYLLGEKRKREKEWVRGNERKTVPSINSSFVRPITGFQLKLIPFFLLLWGSVLFWTSILFCSILNFYFILFYSHLKVYSVLRFNSVLKFCSVPKNSYVPFDIFWKGKIDSSTLKFRFWRKRKREEDERKFRGEREKERWWERIRKRERSLELIEWERRREFEWEGQKVIWLRVSSPLIEEC